MSDSQSESGESHYWYNLKTGQVEYGPQSKALERVGPFETAELAARAPETWKERARAWQEDEAAED